MHLRAPRTKDEHKFVTNDRNEWLRSNRSDKRPLSALFRIQASPASHTHIRVRVFGKPFRFACGREDGRWPWNECYLQPEQSAIRSPLILIVLAGADEDKIARMRCAAFATLASFAQLKFTLFMLAVRTKKFRTESVSTSHSLPFGFGYTQNRKRSH